MPSTARRKSSNSDATPIDVDASIDVEADAAELVADIQWNVGTTDSCESDGPHVPPRTSNTNAQLARNKPAAQAAVAKDGFAAYASRLRAMPPLDCEEEASLFRAIQSGDAAARQRLIEATLPVVLSMASVFQRYGLAIEDLFEEGSLGLMEAVGRFDPSKNVRFASYARWWIRQAMANALTNQSRTVRLPSHVVRSISQVMRVRRRLFGGGHITGAQELRMIAQELGKEVREVAELLDLAAAPLSLDVSIDTDADTTLGDTLEDDPGGSPEAKQIGRDLVAQVASMVNMLPAKERIVIANRFGFHDGHPKTLEYVGELVGLSAERVRQLQEQAIERLHAMFKARGLDASAFF